MHAFLYAQSGCIASLCDMLVCVCWWLPKASGAFWMRADREQQTVMTELGLALSLGKLMSGSHPAGNPSGQGEACAFRSSVAQADAGVEGAWLKHDHLPGMLDRPTNRQPGLHIAHSSTVST